MKKIVLTLSLLLGMSQAHAIRHVGSGGGEAELLLWDYVQFLPYWAQGCNTNPGLCSNTGVLSQSFIDSVRDLKLEFVNQSELAERCGAGTLTLSHEELYEKPKTVNGPIDTPKNPTELAKILIQNILMCQGVDASGLQVTLAPRGQKVHAAGIYALQGESSDLLFLNGSNRNIHQELRKQMNCSAYKVSSVQPDSFSVVCLDNQNNYLVTAISKDNAVQLIVRYNSDTEF